MLRTEPCGVSRRSRTERRNVADQSEFNELIDGTKPLCPFVCELQLVLPRNDICVHDVFSAASIVLATSRFCSYARCEIGKKLEMAQHDIFRKWADSGRLVSAGVTYTGARPYEWGLAQ